MFENKLISRAALIGVLGAGAVYASAFTFDGSDWFLNGGGEATATGNMNNTINPSFDWSHPNWVNNNCTNTTVEVKSYADVWDMATGSSVDGWGYSGPSAAIRGNNLIVGGGPRTGATNNWWIIGLYKDFWVDGSPAAKAQINTGTVAYDFSGWLGGIVPAVWSGTPAWAEAQVHFTSFDGSVNKWITIGGSGVPFRAMNGTGGVWSNLSYDQETGFIPIGTQRIEAFVMFGHDGDGWGAADATYNYGAVDNLSFKVTQTVPEPATMIALGLGVVGLLARRRKKN